MSIQSIHVAGQLQNLLVGSFTLYDCVGEMVDNAIAKQVGATRFAMYLDTTKHILVFSNNGNGMNKCQMGQAHVLHNRSESSIEKDGRFGIGGSYARANFTRNQGVYRAISKYGPNEDDMSSIELNYDEIITQNKLDIFPRNEISRKEEEYYKTYSFQETGTVMMMHCHPEVESRMAHMIQSNSILDSLRYYLGMHYYESLSTLELTLHINEIS